MVPSVLPRRYGPTYGTVRDVRVFIFVIGAAWDNLPPSGPLKAFYLKSRGVAGVARRVRGAAVQNPARLGLRAFATRISSALGIDVVER